VHGLRRRQDDSVSVDACADSVRPGPASEVAWQRLSGDNLQVISGRAVGGPLNPSLRPGLGHKIPANRGKPTPGLELGTPSLRVMGNCLLEPVTSGATAEPNSLD
jgi:hypothetical protein